jgi:hypothetical protein
MERKSMQKKEKITINLSVQEVEGYSINIREYNVHSMVLAKPMEKLTIGSLNNSFPML